jgi:hypothetical protein
MCQSIDRPHVSRGARRRSRRRRRPGNASVRSWSIRSSGQVRGSQLVTPSGSHRPGSRTANSLRGRPGRGWRRSPWGERKGVSQHPTDVGVRPIDHSLCPRKVPGRKSQNHPNYVPTDTRLSSRSPAIASPKSPVQHPSTSFGIAQLARLAKSRLQADSHRHLAVA